MEAFDTLSELFLKTALKLSGEEGQVKQGQSLVIDGKSFYQIGSAARYFGRKRGLIPSDPAQAALVDSFIDTVEHFSFALEEKAAAATILGSLKPIMPAGYLVGEAPTVADALLIAALSIIFKNVEGKGREEKSFKYYTALRTKHSLELPSFETAVAKGPKKPRRDPTNIVQNGTGDRLRIEYVLNQASLVNQIITVKGWAKTARFGGNERFAFIELNDGSTVENLQVVVQACMPGFKDIKGTGISIICKGLLIESPAAGQNVELAVSEVETHDFQVVGTCPQDEYPLSKKQHSLKYLRGIAHLRPRTNYISSIARIRNSLAFATHKFFNERGFLYVHTPIVTASDCEGAGEMFQVTTIMKDKVADIPQEQGNVKYGEDFFCRPAFLTVSGQLAVENFCCALSDVYTFGPTFRAENSKTRRHLCEFWMIEPELAFAGLEENIACATGYLRYCMSYILEHNIDDLEYFEKTNEAGLVDRIKQIANSEFARMTYTEALEHVQKSGKTFEDPIPEWGGDLKSCHERYVCEEIVNGPVVVYNYPKVLKAFYMRVNEDNETVQAMDILVPKIGEVVGGSVREERLDVLDEMIKYKGLDMESYWWYRDLRKYGSVPHAGFGLGFERLVMMATGAENIRDVIPYPRYPGHAEF